MGLLLLALVILLMTAELSVFVWVADLLGPLDAVGLLLLVSLVGVWLTKRAGLGAAHRIRKVSDEGKVPSRELADGALILAAGVLLGVPGFVTGALGAALLVPPVRAGIRTLVVRRFQRSTGLKVRHSRYRTSSRRGSSDVWDVQSWEEPRRGSGPAEIGEPR